nr:DNA-binding protein [uncultured Butyricicoccus sp.]
MSNQTFIHASEVAAVLGVSKPYAYKVVRQLNKELKEKGFLTISGKVSRRYFEERVYDLQVNE